MKDNHFRVLCGRPGAGYWSQPVHRDVILRLHQAGKLYGAVWLKTHTGYYCRVRELSPSQGINLGELLVTGAAVGAVAYLGFKLVDHLTTTPHNRSVRRSAEEHEAEGSEVFADHIGGERPPLCNRRVPDLMALRLDGTIVVEEHETPASANRRHSIEQDRDLRRWARRYSNVEYRLVVTR